MVSPTEGATGASTRTPITHCTLAEKLAIPRRIQMFLVPSICIHESSLHFPTSFAYYEGFERYDYFLGLYKR